MSHLRVVITDKAKAVVDQLRREHGELLFHQSGGCCDGSSPMCFSVNDYKVGSGDVKLGHIHGCNFFMTKSQFEHWKHTHLTIDVVKGMGSSFSLEIPLGVRFLTRSRLFNDKETAEGLAPVEEVSW